MQILERKRGRKPGCKIVLERLVAGGKIRREQRERAQALATPYYTADDILRAAIERGLREIEAERGKWMTPVGNPADW